MKLTKKIVIIILLLIITSWHIIWFLNYNQYMLASDGFEKKYGVMLKEKSGFIFSVAVPQYPSFVGNYAVGDGTGDTEILIWPKFMNMKEWEIGVEIYDDKLEYGYRFYVDDQLELNEDVGKEFSKVEIETIEKLLYKNQDEIKDMFRLAKEEWR